MRPTTAAIKLAPDGRIERWHYPARTVPEGFDELIEYALLADEELHDELGLPQLRPSRDARGRITGVVADPPARSAADRLELVRRRVRERVDVADLALAIAGDATAVGRVRDIVVRLQEEAGL